MVAIPPIQADEPIRSESLTVFPLFTDARPAIDYQLAEEAMAGGEVTIRVLPEGGSVPELLVDNTGGVRVLLLEGEELVGPPARRPWRTCTSPTAASCRECFNSATARRPGRDHTGG